MEAFCAIIVASSFASCADLVADENVYNTANCTAAEVGAVCEAECVDGLAGEPSEFECELDAAGSSTWAGWWEVCRTVMGVAGNATGTAGDELFTIAEGTSGTVVIHGGGGADRFQATANPGLHLVVTDFDAEDDELEVTLPPGAPSGGLTVVALYTVTRTLPPFPGDASEVGTLDETTLLLSFSDGNLTGSVTLSNLSGSEYTFTNRSFAGFAAVPVGTTVDYAQPIFRFDRSLVGARRYAGTQEDEVFEILAAGGIAGSVEFAGGGGADAFVVLPVPADPPGFLLNITDFRVGAPLATDLPATASPATDPPATASPETPAPGADSGGSLPFVAAGGSRTALSPGKRAAFSLGSRDPSAGVRKRAGRQLATPTDDPDADTLDLTSFGENLAVQYSIVTGRQDGVVDIVMTLPDNQVVNLHGVEVESTAFLLNAVELPAGATLLPLPAVVPEEKGGGGEEDDDDGFCETWCLTFIISGGIVGAVLLLFLCARLLCNTALPLTEP